MKKKDVKLDRLYTAVAEYLKSIGGKAVVIGGVSIEQWPGDSKYKFWVRISVIGKKPLSETQQRAGEETK